MRTPGIRRREKSLGKGHTDADAQIASPDGYFHMDPKGPFLRRKGRSLRPPIFRKPLPVWHRFHERPAIQAQSWGDDNGKKTTIPNESRESSRRVSGFENRLKMSDSSLQDMERLFVNPWVRS